MANRKLGFGSRLKCRVVPTRSQPRRWTAKAVGRVACYALEAGVTRDELLEELSRCAPCREKREKRNEKRLEMALEANNGLLNDVEIVMTTLDLALDGFLLISRFVPQLRAVGIPVTLARRPIARLVTRIQAQKAANDEMYAQVLREAA